LVVVAHFMRHHDFAMGNQAGVQICYEALAGEDFAE